MRRKITKRLYRWKEAESRMPLVLYGARQTGKTYALLRFGRENYKNTVYFNFEDNPELARVFSRNLPPERLVSELAAISGQTILQGDTLLFFDEIQSSETALLSLGAFSEADLGYHIVAAGSVLGASVNRRKYAFPVGKVAMATLYPLDFEEYLWLLSKEELAEEIRESFETGMPLLRHEEALDLFQTYLITGGMPRAASEYRDSGDFNLVLVQQKTISDAYIADMARNATPAETVKIIAAFDSIPQQLLKDNRKFQYSVIHAGGRSTEFETPLDWLRAAGVAFRCTKVREAKLPLLSYQEAGSFKMYMADTGLLFSKFGVQPGPVRMGLPAAAMHLAALYENYVASALLGAGYTPFYWESVGKSSLEFVIQDKRGNVVPIEVRAQENARSKNLAQFVSKYQPPVAYRVTSGNFSNEGVVRQIPAYAVYCL